MAVVRVTAIAAGAVEYLIKGSGCVADEKIVDLDAKRGENPAREAGIEYQLHAAGEPVGRWLGSGLSMIGVAAGAVAGAEDVRAVFGRLEHLAPKDERGRVACDEDGREVHGAPLGRPPRRFVEPEARADQAVARAKAKDPTLSPERETAIRSRALADNRQSVGYYDVTFSPDKSVSVYWAALHATGQTQAADAVAGAHDAAVREAARYLEQHVAYTRGGRGSAAGGVQEYQQADGLVMVPFRHSTSRENEPQLHTHLAVLNRVVSRVDGKVRALDGRGFAPVKQAAEAVYERALARGIGKATGAVMELRPDGVSRRVVGVDEGLCRAGSSRRGDVEAQIEAWTIEYRETHGREPSPAVGKEMAQAAVFKTRPAKQGPGGPEGFRPWTDRHAGQLAEVPGRVADAAAGQATAPVAGVTGDGRVDWPAAIRAGVADVQREFATWQLGDLFNKVDRHLPAELAVPAGMERAGFVHATLAEVLADGTGFGVVALGPRDAVTPPGELAGPDGRSPYRPHLHWDRYATVGQLAAEDNIVAATRAGGAPRVTGPELELLRVELAAAGLGGDQVEAVAGIVSSGRRADVLIGPAGTGKSHAMGELAQAWTDRIGGRVLGVATAEIATRNLRDDGLDAVNTTKFLHDTTPDEHGRVAYQVRPGDHLVIVDEAGMASTRRELEAITRTVTEAGGKVLFTGDQQQLQSVQAGGMLGQLVQDSGAFELAEVRRFDAGWEREASLGLRHGDPSAVQAYADHGRLRAGTAEDMTEAACRGWLADTLAGRESLLIVASNNEAGRLSGQLHEQLVAYGRVNQEVIARDTDHNPLGVGDRVQARFNDWTQRIDPPPGAAAGSPVGRVTNREIYTVLGPDPAAAGGLLVARRDGAVAHLSADYLARHTHLAYASTGHSAQSRTVDTGHSLVPDYTAMTRGRANNTVYLTTERPPDEHDPQRLREDARALLARRLGEHGPEPTATLIGREGEAHTRSLAWIGGQWDQVQHAHGHPRYEALLAEQVAARHGDQTAADLPGEPGYPRLIRAMYSAELGGHQPEALLDEVTARGLADADSLADVLRYRIHRALADGREPEQQAHPGDWTTLAAPLDGPAGQWAHELARAASERQAELGEAAAIDQSAWTAALGPVPDAVAEPAARAGWEARAGIVAGYRDLAGVPDEQVSLGAPPSRERPLEHAVYHHAAHTLGYQSDPEAGDVRVLSDTELYAVRERWTREQSWAPAYVADELSAAYQAAATAGQDADLTAARLAQLPPDAEGREWVAAQHAISARDAEAQLERAHQLEQVHQARAGWAQATAAVEAADRDAALELERRGLALQRATAPEPEQLGLFTQPLSEARAAAVTPEQGERQAHESAAPASGPADDAEVAAAHHARANAVAGFHRDLEARHQARLAEIDPDQRLDPAARDAALRADNLARAVAAIRAEHGARLDPHSEMDDETLAHARAAELAEQRATAEPQQTAARAEAHREIDPDGRLSDDVRDAVHWQRAHDRAATAHTRDRTPADAEAPEAEAPRRWDEPQSQQIDRTEQPDRTRRTEGRDRSEARDRDGQLSLLDVAPSPTDTAAVQDARRTPVDRSRTDRDHRIIEAARAEGDDTVRAEDDVWRPERRHHRDERPTISAAVPAGDDRDAGRDDGDRAVTLAEARRQAHAADGQRAAREAAALERGTQHQATTATTTDDTDRTRRDTTLTEPAEAQQTRQPDGTTAAQQQEAPRVVRTPGPQ